MAEAEEQVERVADKLYGAALEEFTPRRDKRAKALRKEGDKAAADAVKALRKPSQTAWALNQVVRRRREDVERLLEAGAELRRAHEAVLSGGDPDRLAAASEQERRVVGELVKTAARIAAECGVGATSTLQERRRSTLEAAVRDSEVREALRAGRLTADHQAVGLFDLSGWQPSSADPRKDRRPARTVKVRNRPERERREEKEKRDAAREKSARESREAEQAQRVEKARQLLEEARQGQEAIAEHLADATRAAAEARHRAEQVLAQAEQAEEAQRAVQGQLDEAEAHTRRREEELRRAEREKVA